MLLPAFEYHRPTGLAEAFEVLDHYAGKARVLAGGTDLLVNMKRKTVAPKQLVGLERVAELLGVRAGNGRIEIGARETAARLAGAGGIARDLGVLAMAAAKLGSPQVRNLATIGGNLCTARPAADMPLPLLVLDARVVLAGSAGEREVGLDAFFAGPGQTVAQPKEILTKVVIDRAEPGTGGGFVKLGLRRTLEIALVNAAALLTLDVDGKTIKKARVALGAVAPTPIRAPEAERVLLGKVASDELFAHAGEAAKQDARPITDHRGSATFRLEMVSVLTRRALHQAWENAREQ
ncbi:MAG: xanthine dehydrogenase family protein subunit M [Deltaproteobacteria bacterium]|nr:xanthine dehydrogenase family protein subunit M [Deltaproteobacteria bacterium]